MDRLAAAFPVAFRDREDHRGLWSFLLSLCVTQWRGQLGKVESPHLSVSPLSTAPLDVKGNKNPLLF